MCTDAVDFLMGGRGVTWFQAALALRCCGISVILVNAGICHGVMMRADSLSAPAVEGLGIKVVDNKANPSAR